MGVFVGCLVSFQMNERATVICQKAGRPTLVHGDVFIGRFFDNDDAFFRMDFRLADLRDDAPFFAMARAAQVIRML